MTSDRKFYTNKGNVITIKDISKSDAVPGKLCMTIILNGKEYTSDHVEPEKLQKFVNNQAVNKKIAELKEREKFIKDNNISKLYYATNYKNLESILKNGILSKSELIKRGITFVPSNTRANLNSHDISLSISHFNYDLLNRLSNHNRKFDTIVLVTNTKPLLMVDTEFSKNSTSYSRIEKTSDISKIFDGNRKYKDDTGIMRELIDFYPTSPNAEALVKDYIDSSNITHILSLSGMDSDTKNIINNLAFDYGKDYNTLKEFWPRCDQKTLK